jgi:hypothetical protein
LKPDFKSHIDYQNFVIENLRKFYSGELLVLVNSDWPTIQKLWITDLSDVHYLLIDSYADKGPAGYPPASMLRAYLLNLLVAPTMSLTKWVDQLRRVPLYAIISGFEPHKTPAIGTFYDFFNRLWLSDQDNFHGHVKPKKRKKSKKKKPKKGKKMSIKKPGVLQRLINRYFKYGSSFKPKATDRLFELFQNSFLSISAAYDLLGDLTQFSISGDGTPVKTAALLRNKKLKDNDQFAHHFQPDTDSGWDSSRSKFYNGYHLYMLTACDSPNDLPIYPTLNKASRHDSVSLLLNLNEFHHRFDICSVDKILLDAAHDAKAIYELLNKHNTDAFIDLNKRTKFNFEGKSDITFSELGIPICSQNLEMKSNGFDYTQDRKKWRCPKAKGTTIDCPNPCSDAKYGRNFQTYPKDDLRIFTKIPRGSEKWKLVYNKRTSSERTNKREKVDYQLEAGRHKSTKMWYIRLYAIMMCQHIDAWFSHLEGALDLQELIAI